MNDKIMELIRQAETPQRDPSNDFLDDVLDGKAHYHVDTPAFREALRRRRAERARSRS